ncbi:MAG: hypothetical protein LC789_11950 [Actinobacteria bacterium]|nr:hypothetical protein [Actinomycetota bacterium]MCA1720459.1 hypothetical protein [Actinomycetota bacterium]
MPELTDEEFEALYGRWQPPALDELADLLGPVRWWVAGGWALELFSGVPRPHEDVDVGIPRSELRGLVARLSHLHLWTAQDGALRPLRWFDELPAEYEQLWARRNAQSPWLLDLLLTPVVEDEWVFKRDPRLRLPMHRAVRTTRGIPHLAPEVALLHKAHLRRPKDERDLDVVLPLLDDEARRWLRDALALTVPDSPWGSRV